jgi:hypothetical protein
LSIRRAQARITRIPTEVAMTRAAVVVAVVALVSPAFAQSRKEPKRIGLDEQALLTQVVDAAAEGKHTEGNAWLTWAPHFLRGPDRKTYIPFTLKIEEAPGAFKSAAMYVRVAPRGDLGRAGKKADGVQNVLGVANGEMPINSPERRQGSGAPTANDASLMLRSLTAKNAGQGYPYEAAYGIETVSAKNGTVATLQSGLALPAGEYDLYIALLERERKGDKRWAVLKQPITVPDLATSSLRMSSIILAERVEELSKPVPVSEQPRRPYVLGSSELVPALDDEFESDETLHVAFVIYDAAADQAGMPDVRVEYRMFQQNFAGEKLLGATAPQTFDASSLPAGFDLRTGQQLAAMQSLPLAGYKPGTYRLAIRVTDRRTGATAEESLRFVLIGS